MKLTEHQTDALSELTNIAFGRAAASFSDLAGQRVLLNTPSVAVYETSALKDALSKLVEGQGATVHLDFTGPVSGDALLVLDHADAVLLVGLLLGTQSATGRLSTLDQEALVEVGNILLNACLGTFGNLLQANIRFSVPNLYLGALVSATETWFKARTLRHALVASTTIGLQEIAVSGLVLVVMDATDMERLIQASENMAHRMAAG